MDSISKQIGIDKINLIRVFDFLPYPFLVSELKGKKRLNIFVNNKFIEEIGYSCTDIPTIDDWFETAYPDSNYRNEIKLQWTFLEKDARAKGKDSLLLPARIRTKEGAYKWYEVKASVKGAISLVAFVNIDEKIKREQELQRLNEIKNRTLSILSHDLRSPLNSLDAVLRMVTSEMISEKEKKVLMEKIGRQVFQMTEFVETTLNWTKANFSEQQPQTGPVDLIKITEAILGLYAISITRKKLLVTSRVDPKIKVTGDTEVYSIIIRNLISNAIKYTPESGHLHLHNFEKDGRHVFAIENTGSHLSAEKIRSILEMNYVSLQGTAGEKGLGLGLKLCRQLLDKRGGRMMIECPDESRTIFSFVL